MSALAKIDVPHVQSYTDRHGKRRYYYRRRGFARATLPPPTDPGFAAAYKAASKEKREIGSEATIPGSLDALLASYYLSASFKALRPSTQKAQKGQLERFRREYGAYPVADFTPENLTGIFERMSSAAQASNLRKRLRRLFRYAKALRWISDNPVTDSEAPRYRTDGFTPWSDDDIAAFEERWPSGSKPRLALCLLLYAAQRRSDTVTMGRQHIRDGRIHIKQKKTGIELRVRIHPDLQRELDQHPANMTFLLTDYGKPFSEAGFTAWFVDKAQKAGLTDRTPHGLRKAAGRRLAEAGATAKEIMAVLGHRTLSEAQKYVESADQTKLADSGLARLA